MKSSSVSIGADKWLYWLTDQENLSPSRISKMWRSRKILLCPIFRDITWKNLLTFHHLAVDPLRVLTGEGHDFLRIIEVLLWCSVSNSAEEFSGIEFRSSIHSLLVITVRPSICDVASGTDASDLEHMHLCFFGIAEFHILL